MEPALGTCLALARFFAVCLGVVLGARVWSKQRAAKKGALLAAAAGVAWAALAVIAVEMVVVPALRAEALQQGGTVAIRWDTYSIAVFTGFAVGIALSARQAGISGICLGEIPPLSPEVAERAHREVYRLGFLLVLVGLAGSRLMDLIVKLMSAAEPPALPSTLMGSTEGGVVFYGGFLSSVAVSLVYAVRRGINFPRLADCLLPPLSLGHFIGRLGCFAAGCCYGRRSPASFPFGVSFPPGSAAYASLSQEHLLPRHATATFRLYPTQLFDAIGELLIFAFLVAVVRPRQRYNGQVMVVWLLLYPALRLVVEWFRGDSDRGLYTSQHLSTGQVTSVGLMLAGLVLARVLGGERRP
jgi:phosphatidylglycerol:prolipoprotein diacylglycerol transferase